MRFGADGPPSAEPIDPNMAGVEPVRHRRARRAEFAVVAAVALGGTLGALARYGTGLLWPTRTGSFPWTTSAINVSGCLAIGCLLVTLTEVWSAHHLVRPFLGTGFLGGFTTFSTYCVDVERLIDEDHVGIALACLVATPVAAMVAVTIGAWTTRRVLATRNMQ